MSAVFVGLLMALLCSPALAGSMLAAGDSMTLNTPAPGVGGPTTAWPEIAAMLLGETTPAVMAIGGAEVQDIVPYIYAHRPGAGNTESVFMLGANNLNGNGGAPITNTADYRNMMTALIVWSGSNVDNFYGSADISCTGSRTQTSAYGGQGLHSTTAGDTCTATVAQNNCRTNIAGSVSIAGGASAANGWLNARWAS